MGWIGREIGHFFVGLMFLTRLPVPPGIEHHNGRLARSARYFPLIGVIIGLISGIVFFGASQFMPATLAAPLALAASLIVTGGLHEDGLADCCDGLGATRDRDRAMEIMRDSRLGTYGALGLFMSLALRVIALSTFTPIQGMIALVVCHAVSRSVMPPVLVSGEYARTHGLASGVAQGVSYVEAGFAVLISLLIAFTAGFGAGLTAFAAAFVAGGLMLIILIRRLGGYTGDGLGAIQQLAEIAVLITLVGFWVQ